MKKKGRDERKEKKKRAEDGNTGERKSRGNWE